MVHTLLSATHFALQCIRSGEWVSKGVTPDTAQDLETEAAKSKFSHCLLFYLQLRFSYCVVKMKKFYFILFHGTDTIGVSWSALFESLLLSSEELNTCCLTFKLFLSEITSKRPCSQFFFFCGTTVNFRNQTVWSCFVGIIRIWGGNKLCFSNYKNNMPIKAVIIKCQKVQYFIFYQNLMKSHAQCTYATLIVMFQPAQKADFQD